MHFPNSIDLKKPEVHLASDSLVHYYIKLTTAIQSAFQQVTREKSRLTVVTLWFLEQTGCRQALYLPCVDIFL